MKILWFIPISPRVALERQGNHASGTGFWIHSLIDELAQKDDIELVVAYSQRGPAEEFEFEGVKYFSISAPGRLAAVCGSLSRHVEQRMLSKAVNIINRVHPDLVHIHGTESIFGCLKVQNLTDVPTVVSIQGLMKPSAAFAWGDKTLLDMIPLQGFWDATRGFPIMRQRKSFLTRGRREVEILHAVDGVLGRTAWDRSYTWSVAPKTKYFHVDELMRPGFFEHKFDLSKSQRYRIFTSGRLTFLKGMHIFIEAMSLLKREYPNLTVHIAGNIMPSCEYRYLLKQTRMLGLSDTVCFTGWLSGHEIVKELQLAHVYANTSFIENGCNALQEAMLLGVPCVTGFVGGMATTLEHRKTGLMYPRGNAFMLVDRIRELFEDNYLSSSLGKAARLCARERHDPNRILQDLMAAYQAVEASSNA